MADIQFDTDNNQTAMGSSIGIVRAENKMAEWLMRKGVAKSEAQAQLIMLGIAVGAIAIAIFAWITIYPSDRSGQVYKGDIDAVRSVQNVR